MHSPKPISHLLYLGITTVTVYCHTVTDTCKDYKSAVNELLPLMLYVYCVQQHQRKIRKTKWVKTQRHPHYDALLLMRNWQ